MHKIWVFLVLVFLVGFGRPPWVLAGGETVSFGIVSSSSPQTMIGYWRPLFDDMEKALGITIEPKIYSEYSGIVWAMGAGRVQIAVLGDKSAIEAVDRAGGEVAFQAVNRDGRTDYFSHLIVGAHSGLTSLDEVFARAGELVFGDGDVNSTSGHLIPGAYLFTSRNLEPRAIFKRVLSNNHEENFLGVANGGIDVATGNSISLTRFKTRYPDEFRAVRVIWTSPPIPSDPLVWRTDMADSLKTALRAFLLDYGRASPGKTPEQLARETTNLSAMARSGFRASDNRQLVPIRIIELKRQRSRVLANSALDTGERLRRLNEIDDTLRSLENN